VSRRWPHAWLPGVAVAVLVWSVLPLAVWWDNARPDYFATMWATWGWGSAIAALAVVLALAVTNGRVADAAPSVWRRVLAVPAPRFIGVLAVLIAVETVFFSVVVFDGNPRNVDGFAQLFQARMFLAGRLWVPPPPPPELANFATLQMIIGPARWFAQYPPGQSLVLAAGLLAGKWWLLQPPLAALFLVLAYRVARWCADEATARLTALLLCVSPFVIAVAGSEMSHIAAATLGMAAAAAATMATGPRRRALGAALAGIALGAMTAFRPLDAVAAVVPTGLIILGWSERRWRDLAITALAGALASVPTLWYNAQTTGSWLQFGYTYLWGPEHSLGFHPVPWGVALTPVRAVARSGLDLHQLNAYLLDSTIPALLVVAAGWTVGRRQLSSRDSLPWAGALALSALLFFYWHRDVFYGPRFLYTAVAWWLLLLARGIVLLRRAAPVRGRQVGTLAVLAVAASVLVGLVGVTPGRIGAYRRGTPLFSLHPDRDAKRAGIHHALVLIPDGWGSRLIVRMWAAGVPVRRSTRLYGRIDACTLERALAEAESSPAAGARLLRTLDSLTSRGEPGVTTDATGDRNLRLPADGRLAPECVAEIETDRRGFVQFAPFLYLNDASLEGDIVWARDMGSRNAALLRHYADRRVYRYAPVGPGRAPALTAASGAPDAGR